MYRRVEHESAGGAGSRRRLRIHVAGIVQGVGFRPFLHTLATRFHLGGFVANDPTGVQIEVEGPEASITHFVDTLRSEAPPLAAIEDIDQQFIAPVGQHAFEIADSRTAGEIRTFIPPDIATCADCLSEIFDPQDRRYRYAFTNCTNCGPRFTIVRGIPYDRRLTTMARFEMCAECAREYHDPSNRRFHAQPNSCPACGPQLRLIDRNGNAQGGDCVALAAALLRAGHIVAVKGLGGFHLAANARDESAVAALRARKHREDKPFALMVPDVSAARLLVELTEAEERLLLGPRRPIVLAKRRSAATVAKSVAGANQYLGLMLPYTPLHHLLCADFGGPIVLTSGNRSDEPIAYIDEEAVERLSAIADYFLVHDRPIHTRIDDSVVRVFEGRTVQVRRSRGYAPQPLRLRWSFERPILGCGAQLKNTFCIAREHYAFVSHHIGDLENYETLCAFSEGVDHFRGLFDLDPQIVACDLHPEYLSTKYAHELSGVELVPVQHHHAHIASCLAENGEAGPAIGVAFDGLGYGTDGTLWGGEFMVADLAQFERVGSFVQVPMPGGTAAIKEPWRMAAAYLDRAYGDSLPDEPGIQERHRGQWRAIVQMARKGVNSPLTSSVGRLFDAVAAIAGLRDVVNYEGQAAVELEQCASPMENGVYPVSIQPGSLSLVSGVDIIRAVLEDLRRGIGPEIVAARFHNTLAHAIAEMCTMIREQRGLSLVALSGGVFQNLLLLTRTLELLRNAGFRVLIHSRVPANDGGISLGQVSVAAFRGTAAQVDG
jgi:hydrogenase maturation protein HypF